MVVVRRLLDEPEVVVGANVWSAGAGKDDDGQLPKDCVDGGAAESKFSEMRACQECSWDLKQLSGGWCPVGHTRAVSATSARPSGGWQVVHPTVMADLPRP